MEIIVSPSILSADFANLERDINRIKSAGAKWVHIDVMDGHFVPNITIGAPVVKSIRKVTDLKLDVHLMICEPKKYIKDFINSGADIVTFHYEAQNNCVCEIINEIHAMGKMAGLSIKPSTPSSAIKDFIPLLDMVLIMTVEPGFGGQKFIHECVSKIADIKEYSRLYDRDNLIIQVDGGINDATAKICTRVGANSLVAGSYLFNASDLHCAINSLIK